MVISFVIAISMLMLGTLRSLAEMASVEMTLGLQLHGRQAADDIALDCIHMLARVFAVHEDLAGFDNRTVPVMDGQCHISVIGIGDMVDDMGVIMGKKSTLVVKGISDGIFTANIKAEIETEKGKIKLIKI
jgi:hypothetical protein